MKSIYLTVLILLGIQTTQAQWIPTTSVTGAVFDIVEKDKKLFACAYGGIYQSVNDGLTWTKVKPLTGPKYEGVNDLVRKIIVNDNDLWVDFLKSTDDGINWTAISPPKNSVSKVYDNDNQEMIVGDLFLNNVYVSTNGGANWTNISQNLPFIVISQSLQCFISGGKFHCINNGTLYQSYDKGATWSKSSLSANVLSLYKWGVTLYAIGEKKIHLSSDNGNSWISRDFPEIPKSISAYGSFLIVPTSVGIFRSSDGGTTWLKLPRDPSILWSNGTRIFPSSKGILYAPSTFGLSFSKDNGSTWTPVKSTVFKAQGCNRVGLVNGNLLGTFGYTQTYGGAGKTARSGDKGQAWTATYPFRGFDCLAMIGKVAVVADANYIYVSRDEGQSWSRSDTGIIIKTVRKVAYDGALLYAAAGELYSSADTAKSWLKVNPSGLPNSQLVYEIAATPTAVYAYSVGPDLYSTVDQGKNWKKLDLGNAANLTGIYCLENLVIATTYDNIYLSRDAGSNWQSIKNDLQYGGIRSVVYHKSRLIICGAGCPVHISDTALTKWYEIESTGLSGYVTNFQMVVDSNDLYLADGVGGLFKRDIRELLTVGHKDIVPTECLVFPNPAKDVILIEGEAISKVKIYDNVGNDVGSVSLNGGLVDISRLASGRYVVKYTTTDGPRHSVFIKQ